MSYLDFGNTSLPDYLRTDFNEIMSHNYYDNFLGYTIEGNSSTALQFMQLVSNLTALIQPYSQQFDEATLLVNIKGCGYPPSIKCKTFTENFGIEGSVFPCYYSRLNRTLAMTRYNRDDQIAIIFHFFALPFAICVVASIGLCILHCDCRCQKERIRRQQYRRPRIGDLR